MLAVLDYELLVVLVLGDPVEIGSMVEFEAAASYTDCVLFVADRTSVAPYLQSPGSNVSC